MNDSFLFIVAVITIWIYSWLLFLHQMVLFILVHEISLLYFIFYSFCCFISLFSLLSHHLSISIPLQTYFIIAVHTHDDNTSRYPCYDDWFNWYWVYSYFIILCSININNQTTNIHFIFVIPLSMFYHRVGKQQQDVQSW